MDNKQAAEGLEPRVGEGAVERPLGGGPVVDGTGPRSGDDVIDPTSTQVHEGSGADLSPGERLVGDKSQADDPTAVDGEQDGSDEVPAERSAGDEDEHPEPVNAGPGDPDEGVDPTEGMTDAERDEFLASDEAPSQAKDAEKEAALGNLEALVAQQADRLDALEREKQDVANLKAELQEKMTQLEQAIERFTDKTGEQVGFNPEQHRAGDSAVNVDIAGGEAAPDPRHAGDEPVVAGGVKIHSPDTLAEVRHSQGVV